MLFDKKSKFKPVRDYLEKKVKELKGKKVANETLPRKISRCLGEFIRHNKCLQYLDMEHTGLSHKMLIELMPPLKRAKSLLALHIGYNPGVDEALKRVIRIKMRCKKTPKHTCDVVIKKNQAWKEMQDEILFMKEGIELQMI